MTVFEAATALRAFGGVGAAEAIRKHLATPPATAANGDRVCRCSSITSDPCIVCGRPKLVSREWAARKAAEEGDLEIGAGRTAANGEALEALHWYADVENWKSRMHPSGYADVVSAAEEDRGYKARTALTASSATGEAVVEGWSVADRLPKNAEFDTDGDDTSVTARWISYDPKGTNSFSLTIFSNGKVLPTVAALPPSSEPGRE